MQLADRVVLETRQSILILTSPDDRKWCQGRGSNPRPKAYESSALPLSYPGEHQLLGIELQALRFAKNGLTSNFAGRQNNGPGEYVHRRAILALSWRLSPFFFRVFAVYLFLFACRNEPARDCSHHLTNNMLSHSYGPPASRGKVIHPGGNYPPQGNRRLLNAFCGRLYDNSQG